MKHMDMLDRDGVFVRRILSRVIAIAVVGGKAVEAIEPAWQPRDIQVARKLIAQLIDDMQVRLFPMDDSCFSLPNESHEMCTVHAHVRVLPLYWEIR